MKGVNMYSFKGGSFSVALVALFLFTTTLLWPWEKNPIGITLQSAQDWYYVPSEAPIDSTTTTNLTKSKAKSLSPIIETGTKVQLDIAKTDSPEVHYNQEVRSSESEVCNYAKGRCIMDGKRPFYSGVGCKQRLSPLWSCRLTQPDFSFEGYPLAARKL